MSGTAATSSVSSTTVFSCCTQARREAIANSALNGIDFLEVLDSQTPLGTPPQRTLVLHCLKPVPIITPDNVLITGGESITNITIDWTGPANNLPPQATAAEVAYFAALPNPAFILVLRTSVAGDFAPYVLRLVNDTAAARTSIFTLTSILTGFDSQLAAVTFRFKVECGPTFDCAPTADTCPPNQPTPPPINYLAKDYGSFRTILLDRLAQLVPTWSGTNEADLGIVLAELLAYSGDRLSYWQDSIATEAYLQTARSRISLRRHALLVDYTVHDGANSRTFVQLQVNANPGTAVPLDRTATRFYTYAPGMPSSLAVGRNTEDAAILAGVQVFEPMHDANLFAEHNLINFYNWGESNCCLPAGATEATLAGSLINLQPGDVLIFQEVLGPQTGLAADADLRHRCAVRLTYVAAVDAANAPLMDPVFNVPVTEIQWNATDALVSPLCLSSAFIDSTGDTQTASNVSVAYGNVVLADHGLTFPSQTLSTVPYPAIYQPATAVDRCDPQPLTPLPVRYNPQLPESPITQAVPILLSISAMNFASLDQTSSAAELLTFDPSAAVPTIALTGSYGTESKTWTAVQNLLESGEADLNFVVEIESNGVASLRFGDNLNGATPPSGTAFSAIKRLPNGNPGYRIGNGTAGNVGADSVTFLAANNGHITTCRNPLPAQGGVDPETNDQIRRRAPQAFLTQQRAITLADYETVANSNPQIDRSVASLRWTGSWYTVFLAVEPTGNGALTPAARTSIETYVDRYRLAGQDLEVDSPQYLSLDITLLICVDAAYFVSDVQRALLSRLGNTQLPDGTTGLFYPDSFIFGQTIYLSPIYAAARSVAGVVTVTATTFQPQGISTQQYLVSGAIPLGPLQIARLDNDPSLPDHGILTLNFEGGK